MPVDQNPNQALTATRFAISLDGNELSFAELLMIASEVEVIETVPGNGGPVQELPGRRRPPTLMLKRGVTAAKDVWNWHEQAARGDKAARKNCTLIVYDAGGKPVSRYQLEQAWPSKLEISGLKAATSEVLTETVTLVSAAITRID
jgi:phage tail-like protein